MKINNIILINITILVFLSSYLYAESYEKEIYDLSSQVFPEAISLAIIDVEIKNPENFEKYIKPAKPTIEERSFLGSYAVIQNNDSGYCFILNEIGKEMPITFFVCLNSDSSVRFIDVIRYRETRGGEIRSKLFLKQFIGKNPSDSISVGRDIRNIRGATLSAWATSRAVRKAFGIKKSIDNGEAIISIKSIYKNKTPDKKSRCYEVGDTFLCLKCNCSEKEFAEVQSFLLEISKQFSDFYFYGTESQNIKKLIEKYKKIRMDIPFFDIYWHGQKADLGGVWKGYVVDALAEFIRRNKKDFEINFGWSSFYFSKPTEILVLGERIIWDGAVSVSDSDSDYSKIFDPISKKYVSGKGKVAVLHKSAEFSDFGSTLCIIWEECESYIKKNGGKLIKGNQNFGNRTINNPDSQLKND